MPPFKSVEQQVPYLQGENLNIKNNSENLTDKPQVRKTNSVTGNIIGYRFSQRDGLVEDFEEKSVH